jgi:triosephosphate isomerase (TIM)
MSDARLRPLIAGNWKMNGRRVDGLALAKAIRAGAADLAAELLVCPPATLIGIIGEAIEGSPIALGGQDCHTAVSGAHTGDISAEMLADLGCRYVISGHSERRAEHGESDALVRAKAVAAAAAGLVPIICVGESEAERDRGEALTVVARQLAASLPDRVEAGATVIAYEPVWAIGSGRTPSAGEIAAMHRHLRRELGRRFAQASGFRLLYGGSVKPANAREILAIGDVDGALVGGASLKAEDFIAIARACP